MRTRKIELGDWIVQRCPVWAACVLVILATLLSPAWGEPPDGTVRGPAAVPAARQANKVAVISIDREIDAVMATSVARRLEEAQKEGADAVVFRLNTPGGAVGAALEICTLIKQSPIRNTVAWVSPRAYSAGTLIAIACREIVVSEYATMGDAFPIQLDRMMQLNEMKEEERQKLLVPLLAEVVDSARRRGYDEKLVQGFVALGVELWLIENNTTGQRMFIDRAEHKLLFGEPPDGEQVQVIAAPVSKRNLHGPMFPVPPGDSATGPREGAAEGPDAPEELTGEDLRFRMVPGAPGLEKIGEQAGFIEKQQFAPVRPVLTESDKGKWTKICYVSKGQGPVTIKTDSIVEYGLAAGIVRDQDELRAFFGAANAGTLDESWSERGAYLLSGWVVRGVLLLIFLVGLFIEITHPGLIAPGLCAAVALVGLVAPSVMYNMASWWELAAIAVGILCLVLEVFVLPGFGLFGVAGVLLLFGGIVGTFVGSGNPLFPDSAQRGDDLLYGVVTLLVGLFAAGVVLFFFVRHAGSLPLFNQLVLRSPSPLDGGLLAAMADGPVGLVALGAEGKTLTPLRPSGRVQIGEAYLDVVTESGFIPAGTPVRVVAVDQFRIVVDAVQGLAAPSSSVRATPNTSGGMA